MKRKVMIHLDGHYAWYASEGRKARANLGKAKKAN
jgi:hypothetical protein